MPFIPVNGTHLNYIRTGDGPDVVFVHGLASSLAFWYSGAVLPLRDRYRVTAFDLRGHGKSSTPKTGYTHQNMADDLRCIVQYLGLKDFHLVGHSYGGLISLSFARRYPGCLRSLTLADVPVSAPSSGWRHSCPALWGKLREEGLDISNEEPYPELKLLEEMARPRMLRQINAIIPNNSYAPFRLGKGSEKTASRWLQLLNTTTAKEDFRSREISVEDLLKIKAATLITYGAKSEWRSSAHVLGEHLPLSRTVYIEDAGHAHPWEKPGEFVKSWLDFVASYERASSHDGRERRRDRRFEVGSFLVLRGPAEILTVQTVNVSRTGVLIIGPRALDLGSRVELMTVTDGDRGRIAVMGSIVRRGGETEDMNVFLGVEFCSEDQDPGSFVTELVRCAQ